MTSGTSKKRVATRGTAIIWQAGLREMLGISGCTMWRWLRDGSVPAPDVLIGSRRGWRPETLERFFNGERIKN